MDKYKHFLIRLGGRRILLKDEKFYSNLPFLKIIKNKRTRIFNGNIIFFFCEFTLQFHQREGRDTYKSSFTIGTSQMTNLHGGQMKGSYVSILVLSCYIPPFSLSTIASLDITFQRPPSLASCMFKFLYPEIEQSQRRLS